MVLNIPKNLLEKSPSWRSDRPITALWARMRNSAAKLAGNIFWKTGAEKWQQTRSKSIAVVVSCLAGMKLTAPNIPLLQPAPSARCVNSYWLGRTKQKQNSHFSLGGGQGDDNVGLNGIKRNNVPIQRNYQEKETPPSGVLSKVWARKM